MRRLNGSVLRENFQKFIRRKTMSACNQKNLRFRRLSRERRNRQRQQQQNEETQLHAANLRQKAWLRQCPHRVSCAPCVGKAEKAGARGTHFPRLRQESG